MILLGFDTATPATAVALRLADGGTLEARDDPPAGERPRHTADLLPLAEKLMCEAGLGWRDFEGIAVGLGPGTFTGLRVGVATARGLAQSLGIALYGVSSLYALAAPALRGAGGFDETVISALDARRGELFLAAYAGSPGRQRQLLAPQAVKPQELALLLAKLRSEGEPADGPLAIGDGAVRFRAQLEAEGAQVPADGSAAHLLRATAICEVAATGEAAKSIEQVLPRYGRRPDAEMAIEAASR